MENQKHSHLTGDEVKEAFMEKDKEKLEEISKKAEECTFCKRILLKYGSKS